MELIMDQRIVWDKCRLKEIDQAKKMYLKFKRQGYKITQEDKITIVKKFNPALEAIVILVKKITAQHQMKILTPNGDDRLVWDKEKGREAKEAKNRFNELIDKGYKAYSVKQDGDKNRRITEFDVDAEELLLIPETVKG